MKRLLASHAGQVLLAFLVVLALDAGRLDQPPVWDTAFSVYPSALELSENGFDLAALRRLPGYHQGGPKTHGSSVVTLATAAVLGVVHDDTARYRILHLLHFLVAAVGLVVFRRLVATALGDRIATVLAAVVLLQPVFLTQTGFLYLEIPAFTCAMLALSGWARGRWLQALAWSAVAAGIKEPGMTVALALAAAALFEAAPWRRRLGRAALFVAAVAPGLALLTVTYSESRIGALFRFSPGEQLDLLRYNVERYLLTAPDVAAAIVGFALVVGFRFRAIRRDRFRTAAVLFGVAFLGFFYGVLSFTEREFQVLTRYFVPVLPLFLFLLTDALRSAVSRRTTLVVLSLVGVLFAINHEGLLYPPIPERLRNDFSVAERSGEYRQLLYVQRRSIGVIEMLATEDDVFYGLPIHFLVQRPELGYVDEPPRHGHSILTEQPYRAARLRDFPGCFYVVRLSPWLGRRRIERVIRQAEQDPAYSVQTPFTFERGPHEASIVRVRRAGSLCARDNPLR